MNETEQDTQNQSGSVSEETQNTNSGAAAADNNISAADETTAVAEKTPDTDVSSASSENEQTAADEQTTADEQTAVDVQTTTGTQAAASEQSTDAEPQASKEEDFGSILEKFEQEQTVYHSGDLVEGKVVGVSDRGVLIDFGYKSEGIIPVEEFTSHTGELTVSRGDTVEVMIKSISSGDAPPQLSKSDAESRKAWQIIEKAFKDDEPITALVIGKTKGGLRVDVSGVEAFLPGSHADSRQNFNLDQLVGQEIEAKIIKCSRKRNNVVLSRKVLTDEIINKQKSETLSQIEEGFIIEGTIKNITEYGAFVDIGGLDGLLHVTDMSWSRLQNPGDRFKTGDNVQVKVLKLDREKEKVSLGYKQLIPDPWSTVTEIYPVNEKITGKVSSVTDYGAFIELEPGVEGLVHVSEMSWSKRSKSPKKLLRSGEEVEVQILGVDTDERRISLGMKQLQPNPWQTIEERFRVGDTVRGKVRNLTEFGAFVEVEEGIDGLVHISDISWSKKIKHPKDLLKRDQEVEAVIKSIDTRNRRMSLSIKELTPSAWDSFVAGHKPGDVVRGKVSRFTGFGIFVELGNELEGLCHISELADERVERAEDVVQLGQELDFKILRIENDVQKIGLSARAVGKEEEPVIDTRSYSTEAKGGMASLGELMNLKRGGSEETANKEQPKLSKKERKALKAMKRAEEAADDDHDDDVSDSDVMEADTGDFSSEQTGDFGESDISAGDNASAPTETVEDNTEILSSEETPAELTEANTDGQGSDDDADSSSSSAIEEISSETTDDMTGAEPAESSINSGEAADQQPADNEDSDVGHTDEFASEQTAGSSEENSNQTESDETANTESQDSADDTNTEQAEPSDNVEHQASGDESIDDSEEKTAQV